MTIHHNPLILIAAFLLMALALVLRLWVGRRRFYRRTWGGGQVFSSYRQNILLTLLENFALFIATACVICGLIAIVVCLL